MQDAKTVYLLIWILFLLPLIYLTIKYSRHAIREKRGKSCWKAILLLLSLPLYTGLCCKMYRHTLISEPLLVVEQAAVTALNAMDDNRWDGCAIQIPQSSEQTEKERIYHVLLVNGEGEKVVVSVSLENKETLYPVELSSVVSTGETAEELSNRLRYFNTSVYHK
ncbi:MAG: hypothetical protein ACOX17_06935 [Christensenellales bacterium]|jgi:hypothetical protein